MTRRPPPVVVALSVTAAAFLLLPLAGLVSRAPWSGAARELGRPEFHTALRLSLICSLGATAISLVLGVPLALLLARHRFPGRRLLRGLVLLPMVLPPVVGGVALLTALGRRGIAGGVLQRVGIALPFTTAGAVVAGAFVAMPFMVVPVEAGLRSLDARLDEAAAPLGAGPWQTFRRVTLPLLGPALWAGGALTWARALGEFGATITFAGNAPGRTRTLPIEVYLALESRPDEAILLSVLLLGVSLGVLLSLRGRWLGLQ